MKKYIIIDISSKVDKYDNALFASIEKAAQYDSVELLRAGSGLLSLVPRRFKQSKSLKKRLIKVLEGLINYFLILIKIGFTKPDVLHFQWLPFLEICGLEIHILKLLNKISPNTSLILTIHNVYPHNMNEKAKQKYNHRFRQVARLFDAFIVHTNSSKNVVEEEFGLSPNSVHVCCHGVFIPNFSISYLNHNKEKKLRILQFGGHSYYKGTDIFVEAICGLDSYYKSKIDIHIAGGISQSLMKELKKMDKDSIIKWKPYILSDEELYQEINNSDIIILPYRAISQSGVLLLSIYFNKLIICSDLPSFIETMRGNQGPQLDKDLFFEANNAESLRNLLIRYINKEVDNATIYERIQHLKTLYSWDKAAEATIKVYNMPRE